MSEILIFGDSFADKNFKFNNQKTWYDKLDNVSNYAKMGIGATRLIKIFENEIKQYNINDLSDKFLVVILADCYRLDLDYLPKLTHQHLGLTINDFDDVYEFLRKSKLRNHNEFYLENFDRVKKDYKSFYSNGVNQLLPIHCIQYFLNVTNLFKKVIIWPTNQVYVNNETSKKIGCDFSITNELISKNEKLYFVKNSFYDIELEQNSDEVLNNHLTPENHERVYNLIQNWFYKDEKNE